MLGHTNIPSFRTKWPDREADHLRPPGAQVKTEWSYTSTLPCLHNTVCTAPTSLYRYPTEEGFTVKPLTHLSQSYQLRGLQENIPRCYT